MKITLPGTELSVESQLIDEAINQKRITAFKVEAALAKYQIDFGPSPAKFEVMLTQRGLCIYVRREGGDWAIWL